MSAQLLLTEAVRAALGARGFDPIQLSWPVESSASRSPRRAGPGLPDVAILLNDLRVGEELDRLGSLVREVPVPWVVLTDSPRGPLWGAALELGARSVLPSTSSLDAVVHELDAVVHDAPRPEDQRDELVEEWREHVERMRHTQERLQCLTPREAQVLRLLCDGDTVRTIAQCLDVSESTVGSQVRAISRKLGVGSQLAAVAAMDHALQRSARSVRQHWGIRRSAPGAYA